MAATALLFLVGCSSGDSTEAPAPTTAPATTTTSALAPEVTVRAVMAETLASARVLVLAQPVSGFANVALTTDTEVVRSNGARVAITDIASGATVEVTGRPSAPDTLLARRVVLL